MDASDVTTYPSSEHKNVSLVPMLRIAMRAHALKTTENRTCRPKNYDSVKITANEFPLCPRPAAAETSGAVDLS
jgi:hypothetical protein